MTPFVTDQMASAGAFVSLETNVQPARLLPSNNSILPVGAMASFVCAEAQSDATSTSKSMRFFMMRKIVPMAIHWLARKIPHRLPSRRQVRQFHFGIFAREKDP